MMALGFIRRLTVAFVCCARGIAYVEFAVAAPVLIALFLGSVEFSRYMLVVQKLEKTVSTITDVVTQADPKNNPLTLTEMQQLMSAVTEMMTPYTTGTNDPNIIVIVTDVLAVPTVPNTNPPTPTVKWQYCGGGSATLASMGITSKVTPGKSGAGVIGTTANLSGGTSPFPTQAFTMVNNEEVLIGEVYYNFKPITGSSVLLAKQMYKTSVYMPRLGALSSFSATCP